MHTRTLLSFAVIFLSLTHLSACCEGAGDIADIAGGGFKFYQKISSAPGTAAMKRSGCQQAFVITQEAIDEFAHTLNEVSDDKESPDGPKPPPTLENPMAICQVQRAANAPSCEEVAKAYASEAKPGDTLFGVIIQAQGDDQKPLCEGLYDAEGTRKKDLAKDASGNVDTSFMPDKK